MSSDEFLPASAVNAKSKKLARQAASKPTVSSSTKKAKGKGKAASASASAPSSHLLSTQPGDADADDDLMADVERVPLDAGVEPRRKVGSAHAGDADAAMATEQGDAEDDADDAVMIDPSQLPTPVTRVPIAQLEAQAAAASDPNSLSFAPVKNHNQAGLTQRRKIAIPPHRMTPLKRDWIKIYTPLVEECGLQVRMNVHKRQIEMKVRTLLSAERAAPEARIDRMLLTRAQTSKHTPHPSSLTRAADFMAAYCTGFAVEDAIAMLRMEELYIVRSRPSSLLLPPILTPSLHTAGIFRGQGRQDAARGPPLSRHRPSGRARGQDALHHRELVPHPHRPRRLEDHDPRHVRQHCRRARGHLGPHPRFAPGQGYVLASSLGLLLSPSTASPVC